MKAILNRHPSESAVIMGGMAKSQGEWVKRSLQLPKGLAGEWHQLVGEYGELKILGTAAVALLTGMPEPMREALEIWVLQSARKDPEGITPAKAWRVFVGAYIMQIGNEMSTKSGGLSKAELEFMGLLQRAATEQYRRLKSESMDSEDDEGAVTSVWHMLDPTVEHPPIGPRSEKATRKRKRASD